MINVTVTELKNYKVAIKGGYVLLNGFALANDEGKFFSVDGEFPYRMKYKSLANMLAADGIIEGAKFL